jgi:hypothetical protein
VSTYTIYLTTMASTAVQVEADDLESAIDAAYEETPSICAQCAGWGQERNLELGDEWEPGAGYLLDGEWVDGEVQP